MHTNPKCLMNMMECGMNEAQAAYAVERPQPGFDTKMMPEGLVNPTAHYLTTGKSR
jgi:hypothetical protein